MTSQTTILFITEDTQLCIALAEAQIAVWKAKLLQALGTNGQIIVDVIPEVEQLIGKQPALPEFSPTQKQNLFNYVFQNFVRTFAVADHPLVLFLGDLQWAGSKKPGSQ